MYVSILLDSLRVYRKQQDPHSLCDRADQQGEDFIVLPCGEALKHHELTEAELRALYKSTTFSETQYSGLNLQWALQNVFDKLPENQDWPTVAIDKNDEILAVNISDGAFKKRLLEKAKRKIEIEQAAPLPISKPVKEKVQKDPAKPRSGVCAQIWEVLDAEYRKTKVVPNSSRVKELADQYGWSKSTASVQSNAWKKKNFP